MKNFTKFSSLLVFIMLCLAAGSVQGQASFVKEFDPYIQEIIDVNGVAYFFLNKGHSRGVQLWKSDGTDAGTVLVKDLGKSTYSYPPTVFASVDDVLFFTFDDGTHGEELWKSDGTLEGTVLVKDIYTGDPSEWPHRYSSSPADFFNYNGTLFFFCC